MTFSLNEIEATAKRAARGAGYPWGLAEEAAKATRWLCANGFDGAALLSSLLQRDLAQNLGDHLPQDPSAEWQGAGVLCPLASGASLSDFAFLLKDYPVVLNNVACPGMLLPFVALIARQLDNTITLSSDGFSAAVSPQGVELKGALPESAAAVSVQLGGSLMSAVVISDRADPDPAAWGSLNRYAHKTYAPATEESRRLGAGGADLTDND